MKFTEERRGVGRVKLTKCDKVEWDEKNAIMQVTYFSNSPVFNLLFYCHIILDWEKLDFLREI